MSWKNLGPWSVILLNVALVLLVGCTDEGNSSPKVDPQTVSETAGESSLTPQERELLASAKGREWIPYGPHDMETYLTAHEDTTSAIFIWQPNTGVSALKELQKSVLNLDTLGVRVAVAVIDGGDDRAELIALRESQIVLKAIRLPRSGNYEFLKNGLPVGNTLIVSSAKTGEGPTPFSSKTPISAFNSLLKGLAPK